MSENKPRIILWDLETLPNLLEALKIWPGISNYPGLSLKATINTIICAGWKVLGEKETHCISAWDFKTRWKRNVNDDYMVCKELYKVLKDADAIVTHNGKRFDLPFLKTRLEKHNLPTLPKTLRHIDTCSVSKQNLSPFNNRLNTLGEQFVGEEKMGHEGWPMWVKVWHRDAVAQENMKQYCMQDVRLLEKIYLKLRKHSDKVPNHALFGDNIHKNCPNCGSVSITKEGLRPAGKILRQRWLCKSCGTYSYEKVKQEKPRLAV